ncbi:MAG: hypothetical protein ACPGPS_08270, partial [Rubripirellula sp.]
KPLQALDLRKPTSRRTAAGHAAGCQPDSGLQRRCLPNAMATPTEPSGEPIQALCPATTVSQAASGLATA